MQSLVVAPDDRELTPIVERVTALAMRKDLVDPQLIAAAARAWSPNTVRAFRSDLMLWDAWCRRCGLTASGATGETVAAYVRALAGQGGAPGNRSEKGGSPLNKRSAATIARYLVHIGWAYRMAGLDDPTRAPLVKFEVKAARKAVGVRQRQARGLRYKGEVEDLDGPAAGVCLAHLLKACRRDWLGLRDQALLRIAYDSGCRRSELVGIQVGDIEHAGADGSGLLTIARSKTDREGEGTLAYLSPATMRAIAAWKKAVDIRTGPLLRRVEVHFDGTVRSVGNKALHPNSITLIYRRLIRTAHERKLLGPISEAEVERWLKAVSSHSIRVGVAQDNFAAGESLPAIMQAYRWKDPKTVMRYGAKLAAKSGAGARMAKRFDGT